MNQARLAVVMMQTKKKAVTAFEFTDEGKVERMYALRIKDFSACSLQYLFVKQIDRTAKINTDIWKDFKPVAKAYNITQLKRDVRIKL